MKNKSFLQQPNRKGIGDIDSLDDELFMLLEKRAFNHYKNRKSCVDSLNKIEQLYTMEATRMSKAHVHGKIFDYSLNERHVENILMDTGASGASYISEDFVNEISTYMNLSILPHNGRNSMVRIGDGRYIKSVGKVQLLVSIIDTKECTHDKLITFHIISTTAFQVVIGLPDIRTKFREVFTDLVLGTENQLESLLALTLEESYIIPTDIFDEDCVMEPWTYTVENAVEEELIPEASSFSFLGDADYDERQAVYDDALKKPHMLEYFKADPRAKIMMETKGRKVFVYERWTGIKDAHGEDIVISVNFDLKTLPPGGRKPKHIWISPKLREPLLKEIERLKEMGMLVPSESKYASELIVAPKKTPPYIRAVGNFVWANVYITFNHETIPVAREEITLKLKGFTIYADVDMKNSFHQFVLDLFSSEVLSLQTPEGLFRPRFMPEGISTASGVLQHHMREFLKEFDDWIIVIFDNILVLAYDYLDLTDKLNKVFDRLILHNVVLRIEKSNIAVRKVEFFGMEISENGYQLTDERLQGLCDMPFPNNVKGMQSFLGGMAFCSLFIPNFAQLTAPLFAMTRTSFVWDEKKWKEEGTDYREIYASVKRHILQKCSLFWPDYKLPWILRTDASELGMGSVLLQVREGHVLEPLAFIAKTFSATATKWATIKQEAFAIFFAMHKLHHWLIGKSFFVQTDHANLKWMEASLEASIIRMRLFMQSMHFKIAHIRGTENKTADLLSRLLYVNAQQVIGKLQLLSEENAEEWKCHEYCDWSAIDMLLIIQPFMFCKDAEKCSCIEQEALSRRVSGPMLAQMSAEELLQASHNARVGHKGARSTYVYLCEHFPGHKIPFKVVYDFVSTCATCLKDRLGYTSEVSETIKTFSEGDYPRRMISMDLVGITTNTETNGYINVIVNQSNKLVRLFFQHNKEAINSAKSLLLWVVQHGRFDVLRSDLGSEYTDAMFNALVKC